MQDTQWEDNYIQNYIKGEILTGLFYYEDCA